MLLTEMFSPVGAPKSDLSDIDWIDDLKFFIDNSDDILEKYIFPAVRKQENDPESSDAYKLYIKPLKICIKHYVKEYEVPDAKDKFTAEKILELAKKISEEQKDHIKKGDYENH